MVNNDPIQVKCPVCDKIGYTDERVVLNGEYPCAKHYLELTGKKTIMWGWMVKNTDD